MTDALTPVSSVYLDAQTAVIGSMMIDADCLGDVMQNLRAEDFTVPQYRSIFAGARDLWLAKETVDPVTVLAKIGKDYEPTIRQAMSLTPTAANVRSYARILRDETQLHQIHALAEQLLSIRQLDEARDVLAKAESLAMGNPHIRAIGLQDALAQGYARICDPTPPDWLNFGIKKVNDCVHVGRGKFIVLGADSSVGKTAFALQLAWNIASRGKRVGFFSLETEYETLTDRLVAQRVHAALSRIQTKQLVEEEYTNWLALNKVAGGMYLDLIDSGYLSLEEIRAEIVARRLDVAVIDYLQLLDAPGYNATEQVRNISRYVHKMAQALGVTILGLSQLTVPQDAPDFWEPTLESLRESKQLKNDGDVIMLLYLHQLSQRSGTRWLKIAKNKQGTLGKIPLAFDGEHMWFEVTTPPSTPKKANKKTDKFEPTDQPTPFDDGQEAIPFETR